MMVHRRLQALFLVVLALAACDPGTLGFPVGDLRGVWDATAYEVRDNATRQKSAQLIAAGGSLTMSIDYVEGVARVSAIYDDFEGGGWQRNGSVDVRRGMLTLDGVSYTIDHDDNRMSLFSTVSSFDFGGGEEPATAAIDLRRF